MQIIENSDSTLETKKHIRKAAKVRATHHHRKCLWNVFFSYMPMLLTKSPLILNILTTDETIRTGFIMSWKRYLARTHQRYPKPSGNPSPKVIPWLFAHVNLVFVYLFLIWMAKNPLLCWITSAFAGHFTMELHNTRARECQANPAHQIHPCAATTASHTPFQKLGKLCQKSIKLPFLQTCREAVGCPVMVKSSLKSSLFDLAAIWFSSVHTVSFSCFSLWISPSLHPLQPFLCWKTN